MKAKQVVEFIESMGGFFALEDNILCSVDLSGSSVTDKDLSILEDQVAIDHLRLNKTAVTDQGISSLKSLVSLESLYLGDTTITGSCLSELHCNSLKRLSFSRCKQLASVSLRYAPRFCRLERLWLDGTSIDDEGLKHLRDMRSLEFIWLEQTRVTDEGMRYLANIGSLRGVEVTGTAVTSSGIEFIEEKNCKFRPGISLL